MAVRHVGTPSLGNTHCVSTRYATTKTTNSSHDVIPCLHKNYALFKKPSLIEMLSERTDRRCFRMASGFFAEANACARSSVLSSCMCFLSPSSSPGSPDRAHGVWRRVRHDHRHPARKSCLNSDDFQSSWRRPDAHHGVRPAHHLHVAENRGFSVKRILLLDILTQHTWHPF